MNDAALVARYARMAEEKGLVNSLEGNLSLIDRSSGTIYITPSHQSKLLLTQEMICLVSAQGEQIGGLGKRSSEFFLHEAVYRARPDMNAVIHCHTPYLTAYAFAYRDFHTDPETFLHQIFGDIVCLPFGAHGTHEIHRGIEAALEGRPLALLGGHGVVCGGSDLEDALGLVEAAENYAKTIWIRDRMPGAPG